MFRAIWAVTEEGVGELHGTHKARHRHAAGGSPDLPI
jgi:hypothetical protein